VSAIDFSNKETDKPFLLVGFFQVQLSRNGTVVLISIKAFCWPVNELRFGSIKKKEKSNRNQDKGNQNKGTSVGKMLFWIPPYHSRYHASFLSANCHPSSSLKVNIRIFIEIKANLS